MIAMGTAQRGFRRALGLVTRSPSLTSLAVALAFFCAVALGNDYRSIFEIDPDESNNLIKTLLLEHGASFRGSLWSDQPPAFTYLLWAIFRVFGWSVAVARTVVLLFSALTLFSLYDSVRMYFGHRPALAAVLFLISSTLYVPLSVSVMIGLPALAWLSFALWATLRALQAAEETPLPLTRRVLGWLGLSGVALGLSLGTKLFTVFFAPALLLSAPLSFFLRARGSARWRAVLTSGVTVVSPFALTLLLCFLPFLGGDGGGLFETHFATRDAKTNAFDGLGTLERFLREDPVLYLFAAVGFFTLLLRRNTQLSLFSFWLLLGIASLIDHYPIWPHHRLLLSIPAAALAGIGGGAAVDGVVRWFRKLQPAAFQRAILPTLLTGSLLLAPSALLLGFSKDRRAHLLSPPTWSNSEKDWKIYAKFKEQAEDAKLVVASRPLFAFRAGIPVPPELAVTSWKRFRSGQLNQKQVIREIQKSSPEVLLLSTRWPATVRAAVRKELSKTHKRTARFDHQGIELWVKKPQRLGRQ